MRIPKSVLLLGLGVLIGGVFLGMQVKSVVSGTDDAENLRKLEEAFAIIARNYVEDVDTSQLSEDAIAGMLEGLDPHSVYIDAADMRRVRESFNASFEGVGIYYEFVEGPDDRDTLAVLMPIAGGPSEEAGLLPGDRILRVGDTTAIGWGTADVEKYLKGPKGTQVGVEVRRAGFAEPIAFTITRDKIPLETVVAHHMVDDHTGYIKLQRFARTTYEEFITAMRSLEAQGMDRLVLDLRGNAGGLMEMAIRISDEFLTEDEMIVFTKSRHGRFNREYTASTRGMFEDKPVIVLVDENSASASEIVAGALQDHDRGLVVGRRTFGKGLVQQQFQLTDGSVLQMTISRYYTPSGRLIQTEYDRAETEEAYYEAKRDMALADREKLRAYRGQVVDAATFGQELPDSLQFTTAGGRKVYGGGGILPDYIVPPDSVSLALQTVIRKNLDNEFARTYLQDLGEGFRRSWEGRQTAFVREYELPRDVLGRFERYAAEHGVVVVSQVPEGEERTTDILVRRELEDVRPEVEARIKAFMARRLFGIEAFYPVVQSIDPTFIEGMELWDRAHALAVASGR